MKNIRTKHIVILSLLIITNLFCNDQQIVEGNTMSNSDQYNINIVVGDIILEAALDKNPTTQDFISLLPLEVELEDYAGTEKITYLPRKLCTDDAPTGFDPSVGDITYYAPWGNIAIFYKDFGYANGLINLGKIDRGVEMLNSSESINVRIELVQ